MDDLLRRFDAVEDGDLMLCPARGVAYQRDMTQRVSYDAAYFDKCRSYEGQEIARKINRGRTALVRRHAGDMLVCDIGIGSGEFIKNRAATFGIDINPKAVAWLKEQGLFADNPSAFKAFTLWDVIEHLEDPAHYFRQMGAGSWLFACLPIFDDLGSIRASKHYRPGEHLVYWTERGFVDWMALYRFALLERATFETEAGREAIVSFAFRRTLPDYHDTIGQYQKLHAAFYGSSAHLYFDLIAAEVLRLNPGSILDYGCGRSDLVAHFWNDGRRRLGRYDPAIGAYKRMPEEAFDLVLCTDTLEHILMTDVDRVLSEIRAKSSKALFTISLRPARAKLPDGRNAHVTLLTAEEWTRWIASVFGRATAIPTAWKHILMLRTFD